ncbi:hypothetical protein C8C83_2251 [Flavobacterium sp. 90]|uniref:hypothetical protein n=1 Tax=unclassified Flavobacterium TaxID=196869 RepID=UPI000F157EF3|nr:MULTISPECIES: hypothetical protein [unclassified Flavobacterium]RKR10574.1 hypothetical protein C8C82_2555 [Flavobacterium sp. 81]TCK54358.1 hypothetical protein C8C83_2251 [Flavobacterium sp. 90]
MAKINNSILNGLKEIEKEAKKNITEDLEESENETYRAFYDLWKNQDRKDNINLMFEDLKSNVDTYWFAEKYNNDVQKSFNMIYFEHGGLYGGELEAFAIDFDDSGSELQELKIMDDRMEYLDNISCLPAFVSPTLYHLTENIQGEEDNFDDFLDVNNIYELFEATALIEMNKLFERADQENLFEKLNLKKPFYLAVAEHDAGAPKLIYVIE